VFYLKGNQMKNLDKPWHQSKKFLALLVGVAALVSVLALALPLRRFGYELPSEVPILLAGAVAAGVNMFIGAQGWADARSSVVPREPT